MRLVLRRARGARSLLLAAIVATLIAVSFVVGLLAYGREVVAAAARTTIGSAPPEDRSVLIRGTANAGGSSLDAKDASLRTHLADGLGGRAVDVTTAGFAAGRQLTGRVGTAVGDQDGAVFAAVTFLDRLAGHTALVSGTWASPGASPAQVTVGRAAAAVLQLKIGDLVPITDRSTGVTTPVAVVGIWEPTDLTDPYWLLVPGVSGGANPGGHTYGPIVLDRADFVRSWATGASVAWILRPDLGAVDLATLTRLGAQTDSVRRLPDAIGLAGTGQVSTTLDRLVLRLDRADLVGRSALLTPVLLIVVLGVYALLLIAMLLTEHRRGETALIRARGAARLQIAGLASREAAMLVLPAVLLAPPLAAAVLRAAGRLPAFADISLRLTPDLDPWLWAVAVGAGLVCLAAMVGPSVRRSGTYVEELGSRSRPTRLAFAQRASVDIALVVLAVLAWFQLRQYASPVTGHGSGLGIDPLLVAAPTVGVLAGAVLSLRLLPVLTRRVERFVDRKHWPATMFGMWQAGRRPHAGPVLLLALAAAVSTLAWSLLSTAQRSIVDQSDFSVGADLRFVEANGFAPDDRTAAVAALPGVAVAAPVSRNVLRLGPESLRTEVVGIDPAAAANVVKYRDDLGGGADMFATIEQARSALPVVALPAGAHRFAADLYANGSGVDAELTTTLVVLTSNGQLVQVPVGTVSTNSAPRRFDVELPDRTASIIGVRVAVAGPPGFALTWNLTNAQVADAIGNWSKVNFGSVGDWQLVDALGRKVTDRIAAVDGISAQRVVPEGYTVVASPNFELIPAQELATVPAAVTPDVLTALRAEVGKNVLVTLGGIDVRLRIVAVVSAVPATSGAAMFVDLPSLSVLAGRSRPYAATIAETWVAAQPGTTATVVAEARQLTGVHVLDRETAAATAGQEPYGVGGRAALFAAGLGALLLALIGIGVDIRSTARRRVGEFAVLQTMGAGSRLLARAVMAEQAFLAGLGVIVGLVVGAGVAATMAPLVILTPSADRPQPLPLLSVPWLPVVGTGVVLFGAAMLLSGAVAATLGRRLAIARLRIGDEL